MMNVMKESRLLQDKLVSMRRDLHRIPEIGFTLPETRKYITDRLEALGIAFALNEEDSGLIAYINKGKPGKILVLRSDMDALPITEETGAAYASEHEGMMHACGHDGHMAMMLGAIRILKEMRDCLRGEVRILFQPAEEISIGARDMIAAGALDGVDALYGAHIWSEVEAGTVSCEAGPRMAFTDWFRIDIEGVSAHGSMPHKGVDAIVIAAEIVDALQVIVSRRTSPFEPVVITVGDDGAALQRKI
jgi:amidohydrolase